ncbi:LysE family translocator [Photobacterium sp. CCB-ST2H9]|uniref:LysE family translocator n=1 Tax=unclassified Photobacterium TaxID=2628852 RepID=UPI002006269C|nr:LysE family translocator [Photobacterium sp. CCB-ST2H9]UTM60303.1 LysE family translocator [Photobacterium sp. CCB-ST2H9]
MFGIENLWLFVVSGLLLNMIPGPDSLLIAGRAATQGFKAGSAAALGIGTGTLIHIVAAALGLSALLATSATAFTLVKVLGGAYLIYMAISMLRSRGETEQAEVIQKPKASLKRIYTQGLITNLFNPKIAVFFLAFMPQFISASSDNKALAFIVLGLIFNFNGMLWCHFIAWVSASISHKLTVNLSVKKWLSRFTATLFGVFGVRLLVASQG